MLSFDDALQGAAPPELQSAADEAANLTGAPYAYTLTAALFGLGYTFQSVTQIERARKYLMPCSLHAGCLGTRGSRKSSSLRTMCKPLFEHAERCGRKTDYKGSQISSDASGPAMIDLLDGGALGLVSDEGVDLLDPRATDRGRIYIHGWDGSPMWVNRKNSRVFIKCLISMLYMIQPELFFKVVVHDDQKVRTSGHLPRNLLCYPISNPGLYLPAPPESTPALDTFHAFLETNLLLLENGALPNMTLSFESDALACLQGYESELRVNSGPNGHFEQVGDFAIRAVDNAFRICGLYQRCIGRAGLVRSDTANQAIKASRFFLNEAMRLFGPFGLLTPEGAAAVHIENYLFHKLAFEGRLLVRKSSVGKNTRFRGNSTFVEKILMHLWDQGKIQFQQDHGGTWWILLTWPTQIVPLRPRKPFDPLG